MIRPAGVSAETPAGGAPPGAVSQTPAGGAPPGAVSQTPAGGAPPGAVSQTPAGGAPPGAVSPEEKNFPSGNAARNHRWPPAARATAAGRRGRRRSAP